MVEREIRQTTIYIYILLLLTEIGLSPGGSSPKLVQTKIKIHKTTPHYMKRDRKMRCLKREKYFRYM
jgi:hypothetical protein